MTDHKMIFLRSLYDWMDALSGQSFSNLLEFLDCCNFCWCLSSTQPVYLDVFFLYFQKNSYLLIKWERERERLYTQMSKIVYF